jgi:hypothetical protein
MEKIFVKSDKPRTSNHFTLILQQEDLSISTIRHGEMNLRELSIDMLTIYDFKQEVLVEYKKAANVLYMAPDSQIKVLKSRKPILK